MYVCVLHSSCVNRGIKSPGTEGINACEPVYGCWKLNTGPLVEQPVLITAEPAFPALKQVFEAGMQLRNIWVHSSPERGLILDVAFHEQ